MIKTYRHETLKLALFVSKLLVIAVQRKLYRGNTPLLEIQIDRLNLTWLSVIHCEFLSSKEYIRTLSVNSKRVYNAIQYLLFIWWKSWQIWFQISYCSFSNLPTWENLGEMYRLVNFSKLFDSHRCFCRYKTTLIKLQFKTKFVQFLNPTTSHL